MSSSFQRIRPIWDDDDDCKSSRRGQVLMAPLHARVLALALLALLHGCSSFSSHAAPRALARPLAWRSAPAASKVVVHASDGWGDDEDEAVTTTPEEDAATR